METRTASTFENGNNPYGYAPGFWRRAQRRRREEARAAAEMAAKQRQREAEEAARAAIQKAASGDTDVRCIIQAVADKYGIPAGLVTGKSQSSKVRQARHEAIRAVANAKPKFSLCMIARIFGNRHHTSIMSSLAKTRRPGDWR